ncbi:MAG: hypothetical protein ABR879_06365 [Methanomassiliicoccales archaeon]
MVLVILAIVVPTVAIILIHQTPVKASPNDLILSERDLLGWKQNTTNSFGVFGYGYSGNPPKSTSEANTMFTNDSGEYAMSVLVKSFGSSGDAHAFFLALGTRLSMNLYPNLPVNNTDESGVVGATTGFNNGSVSFTGFYWLYEFRIANVVVIMEIGEVAPNATAVHPPPQPWMGQLAEVQVQKIQNSEFRIF